MEVTKQTVKSALQSFLFGMGLDVRFISKRRRSQFLELPIFRATDTFMCSYPRSGNTWTRMIIACLLNPEMDQVDLHVIDKWVPDAGTLPPDSVPIRVFKQHRADFDVFPRVIYNVRDGRDALLSAHAYASNALGFKGPLINFLCNRQAQVYGFWHEHIAGALNFQSRFPGRILMIRYEDIHSKPTEVIRQLAEFLNISVAGDRIEQIIEVTRLKNVKKPDESVTDPRYRHTLQQGKVGAWAEHMGETELRLFEGMSAPMLVRLGYPLSEHAPTAGQSDAEESGDINQNEYSHR